MKEIHEKDQLLLEMFKPEVPEIGMTVETIIEHLDKYVIGQDAAKKALAIAYINHLARTAFNKQPHRDFDIGSNILLIMGSSGSGKTHLLRALSRLVDIPLVIEDASQYTSSGYVGRSAADMLISLTAAAGGNIQKAERGIVFIDEVDKLGSHYTNGADVRGVAVQTELLTMLEGGDFELEPSSRGAYANLAGKKINTKGVLFILGGAFTPLIDKKSKTSKLLGASNSEVTSKKIVPKDLIEFGFVKEFIGRITAITRINSLSKDDLVRIFKEPKDALKKQYEALFSMRGITYEITDEDIEYIASEAIKLEIGARGLKQIAEEYFISKTF